MFSIASKSLSPDLLEFRRPPPPRARASPVRPDRLILVPDGRASKKTYCAPEFFKRKVSGGRLGYMHSGVPYNRHTYEEVIEVLHAAQTSQVEVVLVCEVVGT